VTDANLISDEVGSATEISVAGELFRLSSSPLGRWGLPSFEDNPALEGAAAQHVGGPCSSTRISRQIPSTRGRQAAFRPSNFNLPHTHPIAHRPNDQTSIRSRLAESANLQHTAALRATQLTTTKKTTESSSHQTSLSLGTREWLGSGTRAHHRLQEAIIALDVAMIGATETGAAAATTVAITVAATGPGVLAP
jgi:hypothetical protein